MAALLRDFTSADCASGDNVPPVLKLQGLLYASANPLAGMADQIVWVVCSGDEDEQGELFDACVEHVFATEAVAQRYVEFMHIPRLGSTAGDIPYWIERHVVQENLPDEILAVLE
jgi:hypothetical protein